MSPKTRNFCLIGRRTPAWLLIAVVAILGAGAATGLVLKDEITGHITVAVVGQALSVESIACSGGDQSLCTVSDDRMAWTAYVEARQGDTVLVSVEIKNDGGGYIVAGLTFDEIPEDLSISIEGDDDDTENVIRLSSTEFQFGVPSGSTNTLDITIAIADDAAVGYYDLDSHIVPLSV